MRTLKSSALNALAVAMLLILAVLLNACTRTVVKYRRVPVKCQVPKPPTPNSNLKPNPNTTAEQLCYDKLEAGALLMLLAESKEWMDRVMLECVKVEDEEGPDETNTE
jgi:hypothetical protein